jgi:hypothetical protein
VAVFDDVTKYARATADAAGSEYAISFWLVVITSALGVATEFTPELVESQTWSS